MSDEAEFGVKIIDDASKPAARAADGFERIAASARQAEKAVESLNRMKSGAQQFKAIDSSKVMAAHQDKLVASQLKEAKAVAQNKRIADKFFADEESAMAARRKRSEDYAAHMKKVQSSKLDWGSWAEGDQILSSMKTHAALAGAAIVALGTVVAFKLGEGTLSAIKAQDEAITGLALIQRSAKEANKTFDESVALADRLGVDWKTTVGGMQKLLGKGFDKGFAEDLIKATADLKIAAPDANIDNLLLAIGQIKTAGKLQGDELNQLTEAGLNSALMFEQLEKRMGKSRAEIMKMKEQGLLLADDVLPAITDSVKAMTGKELGQASEEAANSLSGFLRRLDNAPERFFLETAKAADKAGLTETLKDLWETAGPGSEAFAAAAQDVAHAFDMVVKGVDAAIPLVEEFGSGFSDSMKSVLKIGEGSDPFESWRDPATLESMHKLGEDLGKIAGSIVTIGEAAVKWGPAINNLLSALSFDWVSMLPGGSAVSIGADMMNGVIAGVESKREDGNSTMDSIGTGLLAALKSRLGIASPSKEMAKLGAWSGEGFSVGLADSLPNAFGAANDAMTMPGPASVRSAAADLPAIAGGAGTTTNTSSMRMGTVDVNIVIQGGSGSPQDIGAEVRRELERFFDGLALQGAA